LKILFGFKNKILKGDRMQEGIVMGKETIGICKTAAVLSTLLFLSSVAPAGAFPDVDAGRWYAKYVNYLQSNNMVSGYPDSSFRPNNDVTRAEFAAMLAKSRGITVTPGVQTQFRDVPSSHWASGAVSLASSKGWITGYPDGTFGPDKPITHAEMYTIVSKLLEGDTPANTSNVLSDFTDSGSVPTWAEQPVAMVVSNGVYINEVTPNQIDPFNRATRADVATTLAKLVNQPFRTPITIATTQVPEVQPTAPEPEPEAVAETVTNTGTIRRSADGWQLHTLAGVYQIANDSVHYGHFIEGQEVNFTGALLPPRAGVGRRFVRLSNFQPTVIGRDRPNRPDRNVTISGVLQPSLRGAGWVVNETGTHQKFVLRDIAAFESRPWFKAGQAIQVQGAVRPGAPGTPNSQALFVSMVRPDNFAGQPGPGGQGIVNVVGQLNRTVEPGGWTVTDRHTNQKYFLMQAEEFENRRWFHEGQTVRVEGTPRPNRPHAHMEGTPLAVNDMQVMPM
jgi:hypothetical protein